MCPRPPARLLPKQVGELVERQNKEAAAAPAYFQEWDSMMI